MKALDENLPHGLDVVLAALEADVRPVGLVGERARDLHLVEFGAADQERERPRRCGGCGRLFAAVSSSERKTATLEV